MRNLMIAQAAKENGAAEVILVEPDLYYSAQDRGPRMDLGNTEFDRDENDLKSSMDSYLPPSSMPSC